jgi:hypothetical protein
MDLKILVILLYDDLKLLFSCFVPYFFEKLKFCGCACARVCVCVCVGVVVVVVVKAVKILLKKCKNCKKFCKKMVKKI